MKKLVNFIVFFTLVFSITTMCDSLEKPDAVIIQNWGDERFDNCDELVTTVFYVYGSDTTLHSTYLRDCGVVTPKFWAGGKQIPE